MFNCWGIGAICVFLALGCSAQQEVEPQPTAVSTAELATDSPPIRAITTERPLPTPFVYTAVLEKQDFIFEFGGGVSDANKSLIEDAANFASDYFFEHLGTYLEGTVRFDVFSESASTIHASSSGTTILINTGNLGWTRNYRWRNFATVAHELFHRFQNQAARGSRVAPDWFIEGTAEYVAHQAVIAWGFFTYDEMTRQLISTIRNAPEGIPRLDSRRTSTYSYPLSNLAIDFLVGPDAVAAVGRFFQERNQFSSFEEAFSESFGEPVDEFILRFEQWRIDNGFGAKD